MQPAKINYKIYQGSTFEETFKWESETKVYQPIKHISKAAPCVIELHQTPTLPVGWRVRVVGAGGMKEINTPEEVYYTATAVNTVTNLVELNQVNSLLYTTYNSGGVLEYNAPVDLATYSARMQIRESVDSTTIIHSATTENGGITLDNTNKRITITIPAAATTQFNFSVAVYSLELYTGAGKVVPFIAGNLTLVPEVTR